MMSNWYGKPVWTGGFYYQSHVDFKAFCPSSGTGLAGRKDHMTGMQVPEQFRGGTEIEELMTMLRKKIMWHQDGTMDKEDAESVIRVLRRLVVAIDRNLGIPDPQVGKYD